MPITQFPKWVHPTKLEYNITTRELTLTKSRYRTFPSHREPSCCPFIATPSEYYSVTSQSTNLFFISIILSFLKCHINGITHYVNFGD